MTGRVRTLALLAILSLPALAEEPSHPRLLFSKKEIAALREKLDTPLGKQLWKRLKDFADRVAKEPAPEWGAVEKEGDRKRPSQHTMEFTGYDLWALGMAWTMTGGAAYREAARRRLAALAEWPDFDDSEGVLGLGFCHTLGGFCFAYDCLFDALTADERTKARETIRREMKRQYDGAKDEWWAWTVIQNHGCWHAGTQILAGLALEGEAPEAAAWLKEGIDYVRLFDEGTSGREDGSWAEGIGYEHYAQEALFPALEALKRVKRADLSAKNGFLRGYPAWHLNNFIPADPDAFLMNFGDVSYGGRRSEIAAMPLLVAARRFRDGHAQWLAAELLERCKVRWFPPDALALSIVALDPSVAPAGPGDLPLDAHFRELEGAVFRSSWDEDALVFGLKCGPYGGRWNFDRRKKGELPYDAEKRRARGERIVESEYSMGHSHEDAGTFWLNWKGVDLARKVAGYGTSAARMHNVVLVDGGGQFRCKDGQAASPMFAKTGASTPVFLSQKDFAFAVADVAPRYLDAKTGENPLEEFTRHALFVRRGDPGYVVLVDRIVAKKPAKLDWMIHVAGGADRDGPWIHGHAERGLALGIQVLSPREFAFETGTHDDVRKADVDPLPVPRWALVSATAREIRFVMLLCPTTEADWAKRPTAKIVGEDANGLKLEVRAGDRTDKIEMTFGVKGSASVK